MPGAPDLLIDLAGVAGLARRLWGELSPRGVLWLSGDLGSGKTTLVQSLAAAGGGQGVRSPTYALVHEYPLPTGPLIHVDCYRLRHPDEALDLDFPALTNRARLLAIEWPERGGAHVPPADVHLRLGHATDPRHRTVERVA